MLDWIYNIDADRYTQVYRCIIGCTLDYFTRNQEKTGRK